MGVIFLDMCCFGASQVALHTVRLILLDIRVFNIVNCLANTFVSPRGNPFVSLFVSPFLNPFVNPFVSLFVSPSVSPL